MPKIVSKRLAHKNAPKTLLFELLGAAVRNDRQTVKKITAKYRRLPDSALWLDGCALVLRSLPYDDLDIVQFLMETCTRLVNSEGNIHIFHDVVAKPAKFLPVVKLLLTSGASVNARNANGDTPLHCVSVVSIANLLLTFDADSPPDVNAVNSAGLTPLHEAAKAGKTRMIEFLVKNGADVNRSITSGSGTALHLAVVHHGHSFSLMRALASLPEVDLDVKDSEGNTAANRAATNLTFLSLVVLLSEGADVNVPNNEGVTPVQVVESKRSRAPSAVYSPDWSYSARLLQVSKALRCHVAQLKCAGLSVSEDNLLACQCTRYEHENDDDYFDGDYTSKTLDDPDFVKRCTKEVEKMKKKRIADSCITYYDVLSGSRRQVMAYTKNASVSRVMDSGNSATKKFPEYGGWIAGRFRRAKGRANLQDAAVASLSALFEFLPGLCIERITDFLSNEDLKKCCEL